MPSIQLQLDTGNLYNLYNVITGVQTIGVTINSPNKTMPGISRNCDRLVISSDPINGANEIAYGDGSIDTDGTKGKVLLAGDSDVLQSPPAVSLPNKFLSVSANDTLVNLYWE